MTIKLHAQPYDISATGFYFNNHETYATQAEAHRNEHGDPVKEYEFQVIDGAAMDVAFANAFPLDQSNLAAFFDLIDTLDDNDKLKFILANEYCGYNLDPSVDDLHGIEIDIYVVDSLLDLAHQFVDEGLFGGGSL